MTVKRMLDIILCVFSAPLVLPVILVLSFFVYYKHGSPILFEHDRPGQGGKIFKMWKFRSMTDFRDASGALLPDADRLTPFGRFLRATSLDELPSLINVLKGEMSLVGPRPLLVSYLPLYSDAQMRRHEVRPGVTGWAQVHGRNCLTWDEKFALDVWYVDNQSLLLDLRILAMTVWKVLRRDGITSHNHATMPAFEGNEVEMVDKSA